MRNTIPTLGAITCGRRLLLAAAAFGVLLAVVFAQPGFAQSASASDPPLNFANNYFVRGDYVVAGAYGMTSHLVQGFATGTINIPDTQNKGITGQNQVPAGAEVIAAVLYWQTVEKVGQLGAGQQGFFRPVFTGGPASGYPITGVNLPAHTTVSFSSGGCSGTSTGKIVQTYRANVLGALPRDANGNISANGQYEVRLPSVGNNTPLTLGATLVLVYRVFDRTVPLDAIVFYDGAAAPTASSPTMTQTIQGFYDALTGANSTSSLTHIAGSGQSNKFETVSFNGVQLSSLYGRNVPDFPGWYGTWDNVKWSFPQVGPNPMTTPDQASVQTQITASTTQPAGCVSSAAIIVSTTVKNTDNDGLLDVWKMNQGYCDAAALDVGTCSRAGEPGWVDLPNASAPGSGIQDVYLQLDYMCSSPNADGNTCKTGDGSNYSFDPRPSGAMDLVKNQFALHNIHLHVNETVANRPKVANVHAIQEPFCRDVINPPNPPSLCAYPNPPGTSVNVGVVAWPGGVDPFERQLIDLDEPLNLQECATNPPAATEVPNDCIPRFQPGAASSKHEVLFAHAVGQPKWRLQDGTLTTGALCPAGTACAAQSGNAVTFYLSTPESTLNKLGTDANGNPIPDDNCFKINGTKNGRVTIIGASANPNLNGTFCIQTVQTDGAGRVTGFTINIGGSSMTAKYTFGTDPNLAAVPPFTSTASGDSDVCGAKSVVSLGLWGNPALLTSDGQKASVIAGTLMHELGHGVGCLGHGGPASGAAANPQTFHSVTTNCKANYLSVMSYLRQVDGVLDYSAGTLTDLNEGTKMGALNSVATTSWYVAWPRFRDKNTNLPIGSAATFHCDGTPIKAGETPVTRVTGSASSFAWNALNADGSATSDINFDGQSNEDLLDYNDWANLDLAQMDATGAASSSSGQLFGGGGQLFGGGGQLFGGGGQLFGGGGQLFGGGGQLFGGGGQLFGGGGQLFGGGGEIDVATVNSITRPPQNLTATEDSSPRTITLNWNAPTFGQIGAYNIYRSSQNGAPGTFSFLTSVSGATTMYPDRVTCNAGYAYFVTAVLAGTFITVPPAQANGQESVASNIVNTGSDGALTGCYVVSNFSSPANAVQGSSVQVTWTLTDDFNIVGNPVMRQAANTLVAIGPLPNSCTTGRTTLLADGGPTSGVDRFTNVANQFTFTWNNTDAFCSGSYTFELDLDHVQGGPAQVQTTASPLQLNIDVTDTDSTPHVTTTAIPNGVVGTPYSNTLSEDGGVTGGPQLFAWILAQGSAQLPAGISLGLAPDGVSGLLSGIPTTAGIFSFTVQVTDSVGNIGTQTLTMTVTTPVAQINQPLVPDSAVPGGAAFVLTLNGTGFGPGSVVRWNGTPLVTTFISNRQLAVAISASNVAALGTAAVSVSNPVTVSNKVVPNSNIDFFQVSSATSASLSRTDYNTGTSPNGLIAADFNGDGKIDLASANSADNTITILLGNGDGTFTAQPPLATGAGSTPNSLTAGDFDGDGKLDLAVTNFAANNVSIFLGNGNGTFQAPATYAVANGPFFVITGDFNRDGILDLAVVNQNGQFASILLGKGDGTFQPHVDYAAGGTAGPVAVADVALGDFDRDGKLDLAVTNPSNGTVSVLLGKGDGTFQAPVAYSTGNAGDQPLAVSAVDLRGTGILDLAVTNVNARTVAILLGNGNGTFLPKVVYNTTSSASVGPGAIITGDFNADGKVDLAITNQSANTVSILLGNGDGTLQNPLESSTGTFAAGVAAGDFNGDGRLDVAVADLNANTVSVMLQRPEPVTNVAVSGVTASQVSLTWTASPTTTIFGYNVYRGTTSGGPYTMVNSTIVAAPAFTDLSVASGTTYYYVVTAVDPGNLESVNSNEVPATTPTSP